MKEAELVVTRRIMGMGSVEVFGKTYLAGHFTLPPSRMHRELFALLERAAVERGARIAVAAPRGHAKSTVVSLAYVLWCVCYGREPYIMLISNAGDQAADLLSAVKHELEANELLIADFPDVAEPEGAKPAPERWRRSEIITRNGVKISALGAGQKIRGRKHRQDRPTLIIVDDIENEAEVASAEGRESKRQWFVKAVMKAGTTAKTNVVVVGTILHYDALLARLVGESRQESGDRRQEEDGSSTFNVQSSTDEGTRSSRPCHGAFPGWEGSPFDASAKADLLRTSFPGWIGRKYQAVVKWAEREDLWGRWERVYARREEAQPGSTFNVQSSTEEKTGPGAAKAYFEANEAAMLAGTEVLWPERENYYQLMEMRLCEGRASFDSEKQNEPVDAASAFFDMDKFMYWDEEYATWSDIWNKLGSRARFFGACDPSLGMAGKNRDDTAIVTLVKDEPTGVMYVVHADIGKKKPQETLATIVAYHRLWRYDKFGMEAVQFQAFLANELQRRITEQRYSLHITQVRHKGDKMGRIQSLEPYIATGMLRFSRRQRELLEQLRQFPKCRHDDGADALEMAVRLAATSYRTTVRRY